MSSHSSVLTLCTFLNFRTNVNLKDKMRSILHHDYPYPVKVPRGLIRHLPCDDPRKIAWMKNPQSATDPTGAHGEVKRAKASVEAEVERLYELARRRKVELDGGSEPEVSEEEEIEEKAGGQRPGGTSRVRKRKRRGSSDSSSE